MNYDELVSTALKRNEMKKLLCGEKPYEVELSEFTSDVFPTDVNAVLMNCIYKPFYHMENIREIFEDCLCEMLKEDAVQVYIACLYFDTCIFQEEQKQASFHIDRAVWAGRIKNAVNRTRTALEHDIYFANGMKKSNPLKKIQDFNNDYQRKYGIRIR